MPYELKIEKANLEELNLVEIETTHSIKLLCNHFEKLGQLIQNLPERVLSPSMVRQYHV